MRACFMLGVLIAWSLPASASSLSFVDPAGDTFGTPAVAHDIVSLETKLSGDAITFVVYFAGEIAAPSDLLSPNNVVGYVDLDTDQNSATGAESKKSGLSPAGVSGLGDEFYLDLFSEEFTPGMVDVVDAVAAVAVGQAAIQFEAMSFSIRVPLSLLDGDDGRLNYGVIVGDFTSFSDEARNGGEPPAYSVPEPGSSEFLVCLAITLVAAGMVSQRRRLVRENGCAGVDVGEQTRACRDFGAFNQV